MEIPKPPDPIVQDPDPRLQYLQRWKQLFESIDTKIQVYLYGDADFSYLIEYMVAETTRYVPLISYHYDDARILVILPKHLQLSYLIGMTRDRMFSKVEVENDPLVDEEYDCEPELKSWEYFYKILSDYKNEIKKEIPVPPKKET